MALRMTENHTELSFRYMRIEGRKEKLLDFLLRKFRYLDREEWLENIREKRLTVDGRNADPFQLLKNHQNIIEYYIELKIFSKLCMNRNLRKKELHRVKLLTQQ